MNTKYGFGKTVAIGFADAVARVTQALQVEVRQRLERVMASL